MVIVVGCVASVGLIHQPMRFTYWYGDPVVYLRKVPRLYDSLLSAVTTCSMPFFIVGGHFWGDPLARVRRPFFAAWLINCVAWTACLVVATWYDFHIREMVLACTLVATLVATHFFARIEGVPYWKGVLHFFLGVLFIGAVWFLYDEIVTRLVPLPMLGTTPTHVRYYPYLC